MNAPVINGWLMSRGFQQLLDEQSKRDKALQPLVEKSKQLSSLLESKFVRLETYEPSLSEIYEMQIYRNTLKVATPSIAKILLRLINFLSFLTITRSIDSHPQEKPIKASSRLHTLGVIPCAPNALA